MWWVWHAHTAHMPSSAYARLLEGDFQPHLLPIRAYTSFYPFAAWYLQRDTRSSSKNPHQVAALNTEKRKRCDSINHQQKIVDEHV